MERILLNAMLSSDRARAEMLPALLPEMTESFVTREVFEALRQAAGAGADFSYSALEGRLQGPGRELLRYAVTADESSGKLCPGNRRRIACDGWRAIFAIVKPANYVIA